MPEMTGGDAVYHALKALGVDTVFGIPSIHNIPIYDAILRNGGITPISARHEQGAVHMADGYARATGKLGVAITSTGPGCANAVSGLYEAAFASSPVLMITGQTDTPYYGKGKGYIHEAENQLAMLRTVTRRAESVHHQEEVAETVLRVGLDACTGRPQPGAVEIPIDLQHGRADFDIPAPVGPWPTIQPDYKAIVQAAAMLNEAKRPLIWVGGGVITANASAELTHLAESLNAPVFTTANGRGAIPENHPLCLGVNSGQELFSKTFADADVILAVGTRFQGIATRNWALQLPGKLIHLDADHSVIGRNYTPTLGIVGDARLGLAAILKGIEGGQAEPDFVSAAQAARDEIQKGIRHQIGSEYKQVMETIREMLPSDGTLALDVTIPAYFWGNRLPVLHPRTTLTPASMGIGNGFPLAIGAAIGSGKKTFLIVGDGGLQQTIGELATAVQHDIPLITCVFNDRGYGVLRILQSRAFEGRQIAVDLATPDFAVVAKGMGMHGERVGSVSEFRSAMEHAMEIKGPALIEFDVTSFPEVKFM